MRLLVVDVTSWLVSEVTHRLDKSEGLTTSLKPETAP
jgi:phage protein D